MKIVPQRHSQFEGNFAYTYGEWPGLKPCKWSTSIKIIRPNDHNNMLSGIRI